MGFNDPITEETRNGLSHTVQSALQSGHIDINDYDRRQKAISVAATEEEAFRAVSDLNVAGSRTFLQPKQSPAEDVHSGEAGAVKAQKDERNAQLSFVSMCGVAVLSLVVSGVVALVADESVMFWPVFMLIPVFVTGLVWLSIRFKNAQGHA